MKDVNVIGTVEKRELAKIITNEFNAVINNLQQEIQFTEKEVLEQAEKKLGIKYINKEIEQLKSKIGLLEKEKGKLGFDGYNKGGFKQIYKDGEYVIDPSSKAGKFYYLKVTRNIDIQALKNQRDDRLKKLWLSGDRKEIQIIANSKLKTKLISN